MNSCFSLLLIALLECAPTLSLAQNPAPAKPAQNDSQQNDGHMIGDAGEEADVPAKPAPDPARTSVAEGTSEAWAMLSDGVTDAKPPVRIAALSAIGTLGGYDKAANMAKRAISDPDRDVRVAAIIAMGTMRDRNMIPLLRQALQDPEPDVSYSAAVALWKLQDHTGEDVLYEVLTGQRKASPGFVDQGLHTAHQDLHSPSTLARIGATQGAYALLGPFGIGLDAARMMMKGDNGHSARVLTANLLAEDHTDGIKREFLIAITDKDYFVRSASARALGAYRGQDVNKALLNAFGDHKPTVRYMAGASYIRANGFVERTKRETRDIKKVEPSIQ